MHELNRRLVVSTWPMKLLNTLAIFVLVWQVPQINAATIASLTDQAFTSLPLPERLLTAQNELMFSRLLAILVFLAVYRIVSRITGSVLHWNRAATGMATFLPLVAAGIWLVNHTDLRWEFATAIMVVLVLALWLAIVLADLLPTMRFIAVDCDCDVLEKAALGLAFAAITVFVFGLHQPFMQWFTLLIGDVRASFSQTAFILLAASVAILFLIICYITGWRTLPVIFTNSAGGVLFVALLIAYGGMQWGVLWPAAIAACLVIFSIGVSIPDKPREGVSYVGHGSQRQRHASSNDDWHNWDESNTGIIGTSGSLLD